MNKEVSITSTVFIRSFGFFMGGWMGFFATLIFCGRFFKLEDYGPFIGMVVWNLIFGVSLLGAVIAALCICRGKLHMLVYILFFLLCCIALIPLGFIACWGWYEAKMTFTLVLCSLLPIALFNFCIRYLLGKYHLFGQ